jgi:hypothetical protein
VVRTRLQDLGLKYAGATDCIQRTYRGEGLRGFYKAGLAIENPPKKPTQKTHPKNPLKMLFWVFLNLLIFYENNTNFSL